jgi:hypothetical protein
MRSIILVGVGTVIGLALSGSDLGAQMADLVQQAVHFLVG